MTGLPLAYGAVLGKSSNHWKIREVKWPQFCKLLSRPAGAKEEAFSYIPGLIVPGPGVKCKCVDNLHRTKETVVSRWAITLDADYCGAEGDKLIGGLRKMAVAAAAHTTWSYKAGDERYRVVVPLSREVTRLEYGPVARFVMDRLGPEFFDPTCDQACRYMYGPSCRGGTEGYYRLEVMGGAWLDADLAVELGGEADTVLIYEEKPEVEYSGKMTPELDRQLGGLYTNLANKQEGGRDNCLHWSLRVVKESGMDPERAGDRLEEAAILSGLEPDVVREKIRRVLGE